MTLDIWLKDESVVQKDFISKSEFTLNIDVTDKSMMKQTIYTTKEDLNTNRSFIDYLATVNKDKKLNGIQKVIYDKFGYDNNESINQKIKNFNELIREDKDEEVYSDISGSFKPHKEF